MRLSESSDKLVTVAYETADGTAAAGSDYTRRDAALEAGEGKILPTIEDATAEEKLSRCS